MASYIEKKKYSFEIMVGYFFSISVLLLLIIIIVFIINIRFFIFEDTYYTYYDYGNDIKKGTIVTLNGIDIGKIDNIDIDEKNRIKVTLSISKKYSNKIKSDSVAKIIRPLLIGNKQINITPGSPDLPSLPPKSEILSEDSSELVDLISGISLQKFIDNLGLLFANDLTIDAKNRLSVREIYNTIITSLLTINEFQINFRNMSRSITDLNKNIYNMADSFNNISNSFEKLNDLSITINKMNENFQNISLLSNSMNNISNSMNNISKELSTMGNSINNIVSLTKSMKELNDQLKNFNNQMIEITNNFSNLTNNIQNLPLLTNKIYKFIDQLEILTEALENNLLIKSDVEKVKKKRNLNKSN